MDLNQKLKNLPPCPGVYLMKDSLGSVIYVGKSKNLKNRVQSYFYNSKGHSPKVEKLVKNLKDFEYITTDTEFEAFMLECRLIKKLKPLYNKKMKSPLSYIYICITTDSIYPAIEIVNSPDENISNTYFGPYTNINTVEKALKGIKEYYKIICSNPSKNKATCLNYSLDLCIGMCQGGTAAEGYRNIIKKVIDLLDGTDRSILQEMEHLMKTASEKFNFEVAAKFRDYIGAINSLLSREKIIEFTEEHKNIVMVEHLSNNIIKFFLIRSCKVLFSQKYRLDTKQFEEQLSDMNEKILLYFKDVEPNLSGKVSSNEIDEAQIIYSYLKYSNCRYVIVPEKWLASDNSLCLNESLLKLFAQ